MKKVNWYQSFILLADNSAIKDIEIGTNLKKCKKRAKNLKLEKGERYCLGRFDLVELGAIKND